MLIFTSQIHYTLFTLHLGHKAQESARFQKCKSQENQLVSNFSLLSKSGVCSRCNRILYFQESANNNTHVPKTQLSRISQFLLPMFYNDICRCSEEIIWCGLNMSTRHHVFMLHVSHDVQKCDYIFTVVQLVSSTGTRTEIPRNFSLLRSINTPDKSQLTGLAEVYGVG